MGGARQTDSARLKWGVKKEWNNGKEMLRGQVQCLISVPILPAVIDMFLLLSGNAITLIQATNWGQFHFFFSQFKFHSNFPQCFFVTNLELEFLFTFWIAYIEMDPNPNANHSMVGVVDVYLYVEMKQALGRVPRSADSSLSSGREGTLILERGLFSFLMRNYFYVTDRLMNDRCYLLFKGTFCLKV